MVSESTTFYVSLLFSSGCESERVPLTVTISLTPEKPEIVTASATGACAGTEVLYEVPVVNNASGYEWRVPYSWRIISGQGTSSIKVTVGETAGTISVAAYNSCGSSAARLLAVETGIPVGPTIMTGPRCGPGSVTLHATGAPSGGAYHWYNTATGGAAIATGETYVTPVLSVSTTYYVTVVTPEGCESSRVAVTAVVGSNTVSAVAGPNETVCERANPFRLTGASPEGGQWSGSGVTAYGFFLPSSAGEGTHELTYSVTQNGCTATAAKTITVTATPAVALAAFSTVCGPVSNYILSGGQPEGGTYEGLGVENGLFTSVDTVSQYPITYTYTDAYGCSAFVTQILTVSQCTGIKESAFTNKLKLYPNPTSSELHIDLPLSAATGLTLRLFDAKGQMLYEQQYPKLHNEFKQVLNLRKNPGEYTCCS